LIAVVDYGMGNLRSVQKALESVGADAVVTSDTRVIADSAGMVLPGVGAFADCMKNLDRFHLTGPIIDFINTGRPFFGICLGLQLLFTEGFEFGRHEGLGIVKGSVVRFSGPPFDKKDRLKIPHMGWNRVTWNTNEPPFNAVADDDYFYFVHSFYVVPEDPDTAAGTTDYGIRFVSALRKDNVFATQFHPEKSQQKGLSILKSFTAQVSRWDS
jgi:imidazole glycerol-phosphate synthase subunit HisH